MHKIKEMLMNELYEYEEKAKKMSGGKLSIQELERINTLTDTVKNIDKIEILEGDDGYSEDGYYMGEGRIYGTSYARGRRGNVKRDAMGRYSRDAMGRYSRDGMSYGDDMHYMKDNRGMRGYSRDGAKEHMIEKMEEMMEDADNPKDREAIRQCIKKIENA